VEARAYLRSPLSSFYCFCVVVDRDAHIHRSLSRGSKVTRVGGARGCFGSFHIAPSSPSGCLLSANLL